MGLGTLRGSDPGCKHPWAFTDPVAVAVSPSWRDIIGRGKRRDAKVLTERPLVLALQARVGVSELQWVRFFPYFY
jgi:hypothetical protein